MEISVKDWWNTEQEGGPGSGNWEGPGDPRYANNLTLESSNFEVFSPDSFSKLKLNKINENIKSWDGDRKSVASQAIYFHDISHTMILSDIGQLKGIASFDIGDSFLYLSRLATKERGYGEQMMNKIFLSAKEKGIGVELMALPEARGFYEKLGMHESLKQPREKGKFSLSAKEINEILVKSLSEELSKLEPNDGVFCNTVESLKSFGLSSIFKGGPGSGNFGHSGRPGRVGGAGEGDNGIADESGKNTVASLIDSKDLLDAIDKIRTDPSENVIIQYKDGSYVKLPPGSEFSVDELPDANPDEWMIIHNHPNGAPPSAADIRTLVIRPANKMIIVVKGKSWIVSKTKDTPLPPLSEKDEQEVRLTYARIRDSESYLSEGRNGPLPPKIWNEIVGRHGKNLAKYFHLNWVGKKEQDNSSKKLL